MPYFAMSQSMAVLTGTTLRDVANYGQQSTTLRYCLRFSNSFAHSCVPSNYKHYRCSSKKLMLYAVHILRWLKLWPLLNNTVCDVTKRGKILKSHRVRYGYKAKWGLQQKTTVWDIAEFGLGLGLVKSSILWLSRNTIVWDITECGLQVRPLGG